MRGLPSLAILAALAILSGCKLFVVEQQFEPMQIRAERGAPPPPRVVLTPSSIEIKDKIQFELGKATLLPISFSLLDEIVAMLQDNPQIEVIQIEGHTDSTGGAKRNRELSQERAESVLAYIADKGVEKKRMRAKGFGPDKPIADNATPEGREANRRVEFNIVKQGPKKTIIQED